MKKIVQLLLPVVLVLMLAACGKEAAGSAASDSEKAASALPAVSETASSVNAEEAEEEEEAPVEEVPLNTQLYGKTVREETQRFSFTTSSAENATYQFTLVNQTPETGDLYLKVYDQDGKEMNFYALAAEQNGRAATLSLELLPDTTYFMNLSAQKGDVIQYALIIRDPEGQRAPDSTVQAEPEAVEGEEILAAANQEEARLLPLDTTLAGKVKDGQLQWYAFSTDSTENATYHLILVNQTRGTGDLCLQVYDRYGTELNFYVQRAEQNGRASTLSLDLDPETTYAFCVWASQGDTIQYTLEIDGPGSEG